MRKFENDRQIDRGKETRQYRYSIDNNGCQTHQYSRKALQLKCRTEAPKPAGKEEEGGMRNRRRRRREEREVEAVLDKCAMCLRE